MSNVGTRFFMLAALAVVVGMIWGLQMAATQDHSLKSAHAHLNLVGWVTMAIFGFYYRITPAASGTKLAQIHFWVALVGLVLMVPGIAIATSGGSEGMAIAGSFLSFGSMLIFGYTVLRHGLGQAQPA